MAHSPNVIQKLSFVRPNRAGMQAQQAHMKYLTYRPEPDGSIPQDRGRERWIDHGLGNNSLAISQALRDHQSHQVHAWNLIISPNPRIVTGLTHPVMKENFIRYLVEHAIDEWFQAQGHLVRPRYSYVYHDKDSELTGMKQPHAHVVLAGTLQPFNTNKPYRLHQREIAMLKRVLNYQIEQVQERFKLTLPEHKKALEPEPSRDIAFHLNSQRPQQS